MASDFMPQEGICYQFPIENSANTTRKIQHSRNIHAQMDPSGYFHRDEEMLDTSVGPDDRPMVQFDTNTTDTIRYGQQSSFTPFPCPYPQPPPTTYGTNESSSSTTSNFGLEGYGESSIFIQTSTGNVYDEPETLPDPYHANFVFEGRNTSFNQIHARWPSPNGQFRSSSVPNINYVPQSPFHVTQNGKYTHQHDTPTPTEFQSRNQPFICEVPGCGTKISKKGDLKRHNEEQHNEYKKRYICGTCDENTRRKEGYAREEKWKNHNMTHDTLRVSLTFTCSLCTGPDNLEVLCFGSKQSIKHHYSMKHPEHSTDSIELSSNLSKRGHGSKTTEISKRRKVQSPEGVLIAAKPQQYEDQPVEVTVSDVEVSDFFALSNHEVVRKVEEHIMHTACSGHGNRTTISFNVLQRSVKLQGPKTFLNLLREALNFFLSEKRSLRLIANSTSMGVLKSLNRQVDLTDGMGRKTFPMRSKEDAGLLNVWHEKIIPYLPSLLEKTIGNEYSASLVRKGRSQTSGKAVIQIQSHTVPSVTVQELIRKTILPFVDGLDLLNVQIQFLSGLLTTLAGGNSKINEPCETSEQDEEDLDEEDVDEAEPEPYPFYKRYWGTPGPGASIGFLCTEQIAATICCYINVDGKTYILTVKHFVDKSYEHLMKGVTDLTTVVSPALADVEDMRLRFKQYLSDFENELREVMSTHLGNRYADFVPFEEFGNIPESARDIMEKRAIIEKDLSYLLNDPQSLKLGTLEHQSTTPPTLPSQQKFAHHLDWALFGVISERKGANRQRYHYDSDKDEVDYYTGETDTCGAGKPLMETCAVQPNAKVHFVGQATGRQSGEINAARILISHKGNISEEWAMVKSPKSQTGAGIHRGDSGAGIIRDDGNKLVGLLWASTKEQLVFSPINDVFEDIRKQLDARSVSLPPIDPSSPPSTIDNMPLEVDLICRNKTLETPVKRRKFSSSHMPKPKRRASTIPMKAITNMARVADLTKFEKLVSKFPEDKENEKYSLGYIITGFPQRKIPKSSTFPITSQRARNLNRRYWEHGGGVLKEVAANA